MSDEAVWYYAVGGQQLGPVSLDALRQLAASGQLRPADLVWTAGMPQWTPSAQLPAISPPAAPGMAPPPLPAQPMGYYIPPPPSAYAPTDDASLRWVVPVGRSGWAIAAGYLGLFSVLMIFAPIAVIVSLVAIRDLKKHPQKRGMGRAVFGLIMGCLFSIGFAFMMIGLVAGK